MSGKYLHLCLDMLVRNFVPPLSFLRLLQQPRGLAKKEQVLSRVHAALKDIADLVPLAPLRLEKVIKERMPHKSSKQPWIVSLLHLLLVFLGTCSSEVYFYACLCRLYST